MFAYVLLSTLSVLPTVISSPQQAPRSWHFVNPEEDRNYGSPSGLKSQTQRLPSAPMSTYTPPDLFNSTPRNVKNVNDKLRRSPIGVIKRVMHPPAIVFCQNSKFKGGCAQVTPSESSRCYHVPEELRYTVSSLQLLNVLGVCRFYSCEADWFQTGESINAIWNHHHEFHNNIHSFSCKHPLPLLYRHTKFVGYAFAVDVPMGQCVEVPPNFDNVGSSVRIPSEVGWCRLYLAHGCRGEFLDAYEDIIDLSTVDARFNDAISSIFCLKTDPEPPAFTPASKPVHAPELPAAEPKPEPESLSSSPPKPSERSYCPRAFCESQATAPNHQTLAEPPRFRPSFRLIGMRHM
ncbi:Heat-labile enterotoxin IIA, A chain [Ophiocordyceps camponoti-floridani]|uniref:Heat-labile enterotoxin IIA, A chain n=1 Tax=Ophiocordyceps camponoti-floridani TaxID=2030778 RepID=A0A8H4VDT0_9HYPO|nr:Heat-labile enterotoxin IIA, A chain [Ophiocordyceps camponoti-floridani]